MKIDTPSSATRRPAGALLWALALAPLAACGEDGETTTSTAAATTTAATTADVASSGGEAVSQSASGAGGGGDATGGGGDGAVGGAGGGAAGEGAGGNHGSAGGADGSTGGGPPGGDCLACVGESCGDDAEACAADPTCTAILECVATSGCLTSGATQDELVECAFACLGEQDLTPSEQAQLIAQLTALAACAGSCTATCGGGAGGGSP